MAWNSRILEIGALRVEDGQIVASLDQVLDPEEPVPGWITNLTGIQQPETTSQPVFVELLPRLGEMFKDAIFVAHNVGFDYSFFAAEYRRAGHTFAMDKLCTVRLSRALYPHEHGHKLDDVIRRAGYRVDRRHRAYDDAEVIYRFYHDNLARLGSQTFYTQVERLIWPNQRLFM